MGGISKRAGKTPTLYDALGIELFSSFEEIKQAYNSRMLSLSHGAREGDEKSIMKIQAISKWYERIKSPRWKRDYDRGIVHSDYNFENEEEKGFDDFWKELGR